MSERLTVCEDCNTETLVRVPSNFTSRSTKKPRNNETQPGSVVKEFIENTKQDIKREKKNMAKEVES
tara:strand:- start:294 stop:494 length:201 start_codon:yes stop_codon:yes gene_type:complete